MSDDNTTDYLLPSNNELAPSAVPSVCSGEEIPPLEHFFSEPEPAEAAADVFEDPSEIADQQRKTRSQPGALFSGLFGKKLTTVGKQDENASQQTAEGKKLSASESRALELQKVAKQAELDVKTLLQDLHDEKQAKIALSQQLAESEFQNRHCQDELQQERAAKVHYQLERDRRENIYNKRDSVRNRRIEGLEAEVQQLEQQIRETNSEKFPKIEQAHFKMSDIGPDNEAAESRIPWSLQPVNPTPLNQTFLGPAMDTLLTPKTFTGNEDTVEWLESFNSFTAFKGLNDQQIAHLLPFCLSGSAKYWYQGLPEMTKQSKEKLFLAFHEHFAPTQTATWKSQAELWERKQQSSESVRDYIAAMRKLANKISATDATTMGAIVKGLKTSIRTIIIPLNPNTLAELEAVAKRAEDAVSNESSTTDDVMNAIKGITQKLENISLTPTSAATNALQVTSTAIPEPWTHQIAMLQNRAIAMPVGNTTTTQQRMENPRFSAFRNNPGMFRGRGRGTIRSGRNWMMRGGRVWSNNYRQFQPIGRGRYNPEQNTQENFSNGWRCWNCGSQSHFMRDCDQPLRYNTQQYGQYPPPQQQQQQQRQFRQQ